MTRTGAAAPPAALPPPGRAGPPPPPVRACCWRGVAPVTAAGARLRDYALMTAGAAFMAFGISALIVPNRLADGGLTGVAIVLHYLLRVGVGPAYAALNVPLLLWAWRTQGARFVGRTLFGVTLVSAWIALFAHMGLVPVHDRLLAALYGGLAVGLGIGLILRGGGSSGGVDVLARYLDVYRGWSYSRSLVGVDVFVLAAVAIWVGLPAAMYAWIASSVAGYVTSYVVEGPRRGRLALVVTTRPAALTARINSDLDRGATWLPGTGAFTRQERAVLLVAVGPREVVQLRELVAGEDPGAFVVLLPAAEVRGEGFAALSERSGRPGRAAG